MLISSSTAAVLFVATGELPVSGSWGVWPAWWVGDATGVLIVTPVLLAIHHLRGPLRWSRWKKATGLVALTSLLLSAVITGQLTTRRSVERARQELVEVLEHLTAGESASGRPVLEKGGTQRAEVDPDRDERGTDEWTTRRGAEEQSTGERGAG
ncbi:MASE1 domain-containing protein [Streptomyces sp. TE5632]